MHEYTHFTKVQAGELAKFSESLEKITKAQSYAKNLKKSIGLDYILENAELRLHQISEMENTISELKVKLYIRTLTTNNLVF